MLTPNRARLDPKRVNDLVYVRFNSLIKEKREAKTKRDPLASKDTVHTRPWMSPCEDEETFTGT